MAKFKHHTQFPKAKALQCLRFPFVCFTCRKSFKYPDSDSGRVCPQCAKPMEMLSRKFSAPKSKDLAQWRKVEFLVQHGFRFYTAYELTRIGALSVEYPATLTEARIFVKKAIQWRSCAAPPRQLIERTRRK